MLERETVARLAALETAEPTEAAEALALDRMLAAFEGRDRAQNDSPVGAAELATIASSRSPARRRLGLPLLAAAGLVGVLFVAASLLRGPASDVDVDDRVQEPAAVEQPLDRPGEPGPGVGRFEPEPTGALPQLVDGRFASDQLGTPMSLDTGRPLWLVKHQPGVIEFVTSLDDEQPGRLVIARPSAPAPDVVAAGDLETYLRTAEALEGGQMSPFTIDEVAGFRWRGDPPDMGRTDCVVGAPCLILYEDPLPIGLESLRGLTDVGARPMGDGTLVVLVGSIPYDSFTFDTFGAFAHAVDTMEFADQNDGLVAG